MVSSDGANVNDEANGAKRDAAAPDDSIDKPDVTDDLTAGEGETAGEEGSTDAQVASSSNVESSSNVGSGSEEGVEPGDDVKEDAHEDAPAEESVEATEEPVQAEPAEAESAKKAEPAAKPAPKKPSGPRDRSLPIEEATDEGEAGAEKDWYILKVASNRENSICDALRRRIKIEGMEDQFGEIIIPTEDIVEYKGGKRKTTKRKLYPGYIVVRMLLNDDTWFLVRETPGIGDFTGAAGKPSPMLPHEVERILPRERGGPQAAEDLKVEIAFKVGDRVRIQDGNFVNFEGDVESINEANARVTVVISIFNRPTPVEFEYWQIESV